MTTTANNIKNARAAIRRYIANHMETGSYEMTEVVEEAGLFYRVDITGTVRWTDRPYTKTVFLDPDSGLWFHAESLDDGYQVRREHISNFWEMRERGLQQRQPDGYVVPHLVDAFNYSWSWDSLGAMLSNKKPNIY